MIAVIAGFLAACSPTKPPTDVLGVASRNLAAARGAEAQKYAPQELRTAQDHLAAANAAASRQDYDEATTLAGESAVDGELAAARARLGKAREAVEDLRLQNADLARDAARHSEGADQQ